MALDEKRGSDPSLQRSHSSIHVEARGLAPSQVRTACPYCGVGCGVLATPDGNGGAPITGDPEHPANLGRVCSQGSALGENLGVRDRACYSMIPCSKGTMERAALVHPPHQFAPRLPPLV